MATVSELPQNTSNRAVNNFAPLNQLAREHFYVPERLRPGKFASFMLAQAGGWAKEHYTKADARYAGLLASAKFIAASAGGVALAKALLPASESIGEQLAGGAGSLSQMFTLVASGVIAGAVGWVISRYDTGFLHQIRSRLAARTTKAEDPSHNDSEGTRFNWPAMGFRLGITASTVVITVASLITQVYKKPINELLQEETNAKNTYVVEDYKGRLKKAQDDLTELRREEEKLQTSLRELQNPKLELTKIQELRLEALRKALETLESEKQSYLQQKQAAEKKRDDAKSAMPREKEGIDRPKGEGPEFRRARADLKDALDELTTLDETIARNGKAFDAATAEVQNIMTAAKQATDARDVNIAQRISVVTGRISDLRNQITAKNLERSGLADYERVASKDPRFTHYNPQLAEQTNAYFRYWENKAGPADKGLSFILTLFGVCVELGVFAVAAGMPLTASEKRGYLANLLESKGETEKFKAILRTLKQRATEMAGVDTSDASVQNRKRQALVDMDYHTFIAQLEQYISDPDFRDRMRANIANEADGLRLRSPAVRQVEEATHIQAPRFASPRRMPG